MKIFISYPHDDNAAIVDKLRIDLEARGHELWMDKSQIREGDEWRSKITRGIQDSQQVVAFLSKHSVRDPGVCLNEMAIALAEHGEAMVTVLVEPEKDVSAPISISHIQWLNISDWKERAQDPEWYKTQLDKLVTIIENPASATRNDELETLKRALNPMNFYADISPHLPTFFGRKWIIDQFNVWLVNQPDRKVFRIEGGPGLGKSAVASWLAHTAKSSVIGIHLCQYNRGDSRSPLRFVHTLAYQLATRLPDYRARLLRTEAIRNPSSMAGKDVVSLWSELINAPLAGSGAGMIDRQRLAIIVDGLDEATVGGRNEIIDLLATEIGKLPRWAGVVLTGRPDPELAKLARYKPVVISEDDPRNIEDLKGYVDNWLDTEVKANRLVASQKAVTMQALLQKCEGTFLYLRQARDGVAEGSFDLANPLDFPSGLTGLYLQFFERRFPDAMAPASAYKTVVRPFLALLLSSGEPLPESIAQEVLQWTGNQQHEVLLSLGSLVKKAMTDTGETVYALFHNSVREWLQSTQSANHFYVDGTAALLPLAKAVWARYVQRGNDDTYSWQVLPRLLVALNPAAQNEVLGEPSAETNATLFALADSLAPRLRFTAAANLFALQAERAAILSRSRPDNADFARDLSISFDNLGDMQQALGNTPAALAFYEDGRKIRQRLYDAAPDNADFARNLSISFDNLGNMQQALGNTPAALAFYEDGRKIAQRLYDAAPDNADFARGLSISFDNLGNMQQALGNTPAALAFYEDGHKIRQRLYDAAPDNADFARDLSISFDKLGNMQRALGNTPAALAFYEDGRKIRQRLYDAAPDNADFARDLSISFNKLGNMQQALGNEQEAGNWFRKRFSLEARVLAQSFARNNRDGLVELATGFLLSGEAMTGTSQVSRMLASIPSEFRRWTSVDDQAARKWIADQYGLPRDEIESCSYISQLPFYKSMCLVRLDIRHEASGDKPCHIYFLRGAGIESMLLDGQSDRVHSANAADGLQLDTTTVMGYLKFFCLFVHGEAGPFFVVEPSDMATLPKRWQAALAKLVITKTAVISVEAEGPFRLSTTIIFGTALFKATFEVKTNGEVAMIDDEQLASIDQDE